MSFLDDHDHTYWSVNRCSTLATKLPATFSSPGRVTNIWGKSGSGKTTLALHMALNEIHAGGKVIYISDQPEVLARKIKLIAPANSGAGERAFALPGNFWVVRLAHFKDQVDIAQHMGFAYTPVESTKSSQAFKDFVGASETDLNEGIITSLKAYQPPSMIVLDEFTRLFKQQSQDAQEAGTLSMQLAAQAAFLKSLARDHETRIVLTSGSRTIAGTPGENGETRFVDAPIASDVLDLYVDIDLQLNWTRNAGERSIITTDAREKAKQARHHVNMNAMHEKSHDT